MWGSVLGSNRTTRRALLAVALVMANFLAAPQAAYAASVAVDGSTVFYRASPGEANAVTVEGSPQGISFTDTGATVAAGPGCIQVSANTVFCLTGVDQPVSVDLGDMDDRFGRCAGFCFGPSARFSINAGPGNDVITIPSGVGGSIDGGPGNDVLTGGDGGDAIEGGDGDDVLDSGGGRPVFPQDSLSGGAGNDVLRFHTRSGFISGGAGTDVADYSWATFPFTIRLGGFSGPNFDFQLQFISDDVENATGGSSDDTIIGSSAANVLDGGPGADTIDAGAGDDVIRAHDGIRDVIICGDGVDLVTPDPIDDIASDCEFVDLLDTTPPTVTCPADIVTSTDPGQAGAIVSFAATATDNVSSPTITYSRAPGSVFAVGTTPVTATATDAAGNSATCSFTITVEDRESPTITCPANITVFARIGEFDQVVIYLPPTASDNVGVVSLLSTPPSNSTFPVGTTSVVATAADAAGNSASCSFTITVRLALPIDIKPGSSVNSINLVARGTIPVAILAAGAFDPRALDQTSLRFGPTGSEASPLRCVVEDVNGDGRADLLCHFETLAAEFRATDTMGTISGLTSAGTGATGSDFIRIVPPQ